MSWDYSFQPILFLIPITKIPNNYNHREVMIKWYLQLHPVLYDCNFYSKSISRTSFSETDTFWKNLNWGKSRGDKNGGQ